MERAIERSACIAQLVAHFEDNQQVFEQFSDSLSMILRSKEFTPFVHSVKGRIKDPLHLRDKLGRKIVGDDLAAWTPDTLFTKITDLVGFRIIHLHTAQVKNIVAILSEKLDEFSYVILEEPTARPWDDEYREVFQNLGIKVAKPDPEISLYTSVHMTVQFASKKFQVAGEIQIRTLAEELWGEVDHLINYPEKHEDATCREQLKVLARISSACTRSVDGVFKHLEYLKAAHDVRTLREDA